MTLARAETDLRAAMAQLWSGVGELSLIVFEDQPNPAGLAAAEGLVEQVSDLQGEVATAVQLTGQEQDFGSRGPSLTEHIDAARTRYWRDLRAAEAVVPRRQAARRAGGEWPAWLTSVEASLLRLEQPLGAVDGALTVCWQEMGQLITLSETRRMS